MLERIWNLCRPRRPDPLAEEYAKGTALYQQGLYEQAAEHLKLLRGQGDLTGQMARYYEGMSHRAIGIEHLTSGQFQQAETQFRLASELLGEQADLAAYLSSLYAQSGRYQECAAEMEKASGAGGVAEARKLAQAQWQAGRREQALLTLSAAMRSFGPEAQLHLQMGLFLAAQEKYDLACESLSRAAQADCTNAKAHYWLGLCGAAGGDLPLAIRSLQRALQLRPSEVMVAYQLAMAARSAAAQGYHVVVQLPESLSPQGNSTPTQQLARFITREKEFVEAFLLLPPSEVDPELFGMLATVTRMALSQHENYADLQYTLARIQQRLGRIDSATDHAHRAVEINPRYVGAMILLADLLTAQDDAARAAAWLERALGCGADWPDVHLHLGLLLAQQRKTPQAASHLRRALELKTEYPQARQALESLAA